MNAPEMLCRIGGGEQMVPVLAVGEVVSRKVCPASVSPDLQLDALRNLP